MKDLIFLAWGTVNVLFFVSETCWLETNSVLPSFETETYCYHRVGTKAINAADRENKLVKSASVDGYDSFFPWDDTPSDTPDIIG